MIYIDPPYNTKSENFVYNDNFVQDEAKLIEEFGLSEDTTNFLHNVYGTRSHSGWLSFMYPRLKIARELLTDDGVIFISIDDNEQAQLKIMCDEIFGEDNFIAYIIWDRKRGRDNSAKWFSKSHEYLNVYSKNKSCFSVNFLNLDEGTQKSYTNLDNDYRGNYRLLAVWSRGTQGGVKYDFTNKEGVYFTERLWLFSKNNLIKMDEENKLVRKGDNLYRKLFLTDHKGKIPETIWSNVSNAANATDEIKNFFNNQIIFDTSKPSPYIKEILSITTHALSDNLILDFFAGSGTTGDAVMQLNAEDGGNRKFILVQLDEHIDSKKSPEAYNFCKEHNFEPVISSITIERLNRAGEKIQKEIAQKIQDKEQERKKLQQELGLEADIQEKINTITAEIEALKNQDFGYKVFSLTDKQGVDMVDGKLQLLHKREDVYSILYNMLTSTCKPLHTKIEEIKKDLIYKADDEIYILGNITKDEIEQYKDFKINIDAYADFSLEQFLNLDVTNKENINIVY